MYRLDLVTAITRIITVVRASMVFSSDFLSSRQSEFRFSEVEADTIDECGSI